MDDETVSDGAEGSHVCGWGTYVGHGLAYVYPSRAVGPIKGIPSRKPRLLGGYLLEGCLQQVSFPSHPRQPGNPCATSRAAV